MVASLSIFKNGCSINALQIALDVVKGYQNQSVPTADEVQSLVGEKTGGDIALKCEVLDVLVVCVQKDLLQVKWRVYDQQLPNL